DLHSLIARKFGDDKCIEPIDRRLIQLIQKVLKEPLSGRCVQLPLGMSRSEVQSSSLRDLSFIKLPFGESNAELSNGPTMPGCCKGEERGRVNSAAQKDPDRDVTQEMMLDAVLKRGSD